MLHLNVVLFIFCDAKYLLNSEVQLVVPLSQSHQSNLFFKVLFTSGLSSMQYSSIVVVLCNIRCWNTFQFFCCWN